MFTFVLMTICGVIVPLIIIFVITIRYNQKERIRSDNLELQMEMFTAGLEKMATASGKNGGKILNITMGRGDIREIWGDAPERDEVVEDVCSAHGVYAGWDYCVILHEATEQYLGTDLFVTLETRFAEIPGVEICRQEDRELFLIRGKELQPESLHEQIWLKFMEINEQSKASYP